MKMKSILVALIIVMGWVGDVQAQIRIVKEDIGLGQSLLQLGQGPMVRFVTYGAAFQHMRPRYQIIQIDIAVTLQNMVYHTIHPISVRLDSTYYQWLNVHEWFFKSPDLCMGTGLIQATGSIQITIIDLRESRLYKSFVMVNETISR